VDTVEPSPPGPIPPGSVPVGAAPDPAPPVLVRLPWHPIWFVLGVLLLVTVTAFGAAGLVRAPYVVYAPGSAIETEPAISTPGTRAFSDDGRVLFLTVSLRGASKRIGYLEAAWGWVHGDQDVFPRKLILGDQTGKQSREEALQAMSSSQEVAAKVALEHLGYEVETTGRGAIVFETVAQAPVAKVLEPGDVIVGIDGAEVDLDPQLREELADDAPGDEVTLSVQRGGEGDPEDVDVELIADPEEPDQARLGVSVVTRDLRYELPFPVTIDTEDVGGPSAGLALTLGILDRLTDGSLTGGAVVAVTGTIDPEGGVGEVGGVAQKAVAARRAGATLMLVPAAEEADAERVAGDGLDVVGVDDLDDALAALAAVGGNALDLDRDGGR